MTYWLSIKPDYINTELKYHMRNEHVVKCYVTYIMIVMIEA